MRSTVLVALIACAPLCAGCDFGRRTRLANVELRKENQQLEDRVATLTRQNAQLQSDLRRLESSSEVLSTLPQERLDQLWTVSGLEFGRLTGIDRRAPGAPLKVFLKPVDESGQTIKAAGRIVIEAFDLNAESVRLGQWEFTLEEARRAWTSVGLLNEYVLTCPWSTDPPQEGKRLLVKATFQDALTQRTFIQRTDVQ